jgi:hypothetical protein
MSRPQAVAHSEPRLAQGLRRSLSHRCARLSAFSLTLLLARPSFAQDAASVVAKARSSVDEGAYPEALRALASLGSAKLPPQLAVEASLLESTALLVTQGAAAAANSCKRAVLASGFDPEVARDQSPKLRAACREAAREVRAARLSDERLEVGQLSAPAPEVAYQPVRVSARLPSPPAWLRLVVRVEPKAKQGKDDAMVERFDVPLLPSDDGLARGTLDAAWIRPSTTLSLSLVAQDRHGDLGKPLGTTEVLVPASEAVLALGEVPSGATVTVDGERASVDGGGRVSVSPGEHVVGMRLSNGAYAEADVALERGGIARLTLAPQAASPSVVLPSIATGTAIALLGAGGVFLLTADARRAELEERAATREPGTDLPAYDYAELEGIDDERRTFQNVGLGLLIGGGAVGVAATVLWLWPDSAPEAEASTSAARIAPVVGPGYLGFSGTF